MSFNHMDEVHEALHETFADNFRKQAAVEDVVQAVRTRYEAGLRLIREITWELSGDSYMDEDDHPKCPHCGKELLP